MTTTSIATTLGAGSGIDIASLVTQLVDAQSKNKSDTLTAKSDKLTAQISAASTLKSGLSSFSTALTSLVNGGTLASTATSSDGSIATAKALPGAHLDNKVSTSLKVRGLAAAQVANTVAYTASPATVVGKGTMTFTLGTATVSGGAMTGFTAGSGTPVTVTIDDTNSTLQGIADAINAAGAGVTASIVSDSGGARLALKGATGAASAFTVDVVEDGSAPGLAAFAVGAGKSGTTIAQSSADADLEVDGIAVKRASNSITDLVTGMQIDLQSVNAGKTITLGSSAATDNLKGAVNDFVATFNELKKQLNTETNAQTGSLHGDSGAQAMVRALSSLMTTTLIPASGGGPRTLAELGVGTNLDGTLSVNASQLAAAITKYPGQVEKIFSGGAGASDNGLSAALKSISDAVTSTSTGLGASEQRYTALKSTIADQQTKVTSDADAMRTRLTKQFASMDARVNAYKATQTFLKNQVAAWNSSNN